MRKEVLERAGRHFEQLVEEQLERVERMKQEKDWIDYAELKPIKIGVCWGDGIGPIISQETQRILEFILRDEVASGRVEVRPFEGLTIENRAEHRQAIPDDVLEELKACHVILKAPTTTPEKGDEDSANRRPDIRFQSHNETGCRTDHPDGFRLR